MTGRLLCIAVLLHGWKSPVLLLCAHHWVTMGRVWRQMRVHGMIPHSSLDSAHACIPLPSCLALPFEIQPLCTNPSRPGAVGPCFPESPWGLPPRVLSNTRSITSELPSSCKLVCRDSVTVGEDYTNASCWERPWRNGAQRISWAVTGAGVQGRLLLYSDAIS